MFLVLANDARQFHPCIAAYTYRAKPSRGEKVLRFIQHLKRLCAGFGQYACLIEDFGVVVQLRRSRPPPKLWRALLGVLSQNFLQLVDDVVSLAARVKPDTALRASSLS